MEAPLRDSSGLPRRARRKRDWGRTFARALCAFFALVGALPVLLALLVRSASVQAWVTRETTRLLAREGITARFHVGVRLWPLSLDVTDIRVDSKDGGAPVVVSRRASVRPRFFPLLSGKLAIDQIDLDAPRVHLVIEGMTIKNMGIDIPKSTGGAIHAPFDVFAITDGAADVTIDGVHAVAEDIDLDVTADDDPVEGSSFEIAVRAGESKVERGRATKEGGLIDAWDEDKICSVEGRLRIEPNDIEVHRLKASAIADLDPGPNTLGECNLPSTDRRHVEVSLSHMHIGLPRKKGDLPRVDGHATARAPIGLGARFVAFPDNDGWVAADVDVRLAEGMTFPDLNGHLEAHDIRVGDYSFAHEIQSDIKTDQGVITSPKTTVTIAGGVATLTDVRVEPLTKGIPLRAKLDVKDADFTKLMADLGVSQHSHVQWDLNEVHAAVFSGTIVPLKLDTDFIAKTKNFNVYDVAVDNPARARMIGVKEAVIVAHCGVRPHALQFSNAHAQMPNSHLDGGFVSIGFQDDLRVEVPDAVVDLADIGPLGTIPLAGHAHASVVVSGLFNDPHVEGDASIDGFMLGGIPFGDVTGGHVALNGLVVSLKDIKATKNKSSYEMPSGTLDFGGKANMTMDAVIASNNFDARDFFALWQMEDDPRFTEIGGVIQTKSSVHLALGGPQDKCGGGFIDVDAHAHLRDVKLFGEAFDDGDLDMDYEWDDREAGLSGANIDVHSFTLRKVRPNAAGVAVGTVFGSATIDKGVLNGNVIAQGVPLSRVQALSTYVPQVDGSVSGFAQVSGNLDDFKVEGDFDATPVLVHATKLGASHAHVQITQISKDTRVTKKTACGGPIAPPFDKEAYFKDTSSHGLITVDGALFGGQVNLRGLTITRQDDVHVAGAVAFDKLDLGSIAHMLMPKPIDENAAPPPPIEGQLTGLLTIDRLARSELSKAELHFSPTSLTVGRSGQQLSLRTKDGPPPALVVANDSVQIPSLVFDLQAPNGLHGSVSLKGAVNKLSRSPELALDAEVAPIDLGVLVGIVPKLDRAQGVLDGSLHLTGPASSPDVDGRVHVRGGDFSIHGVPSAIQNVEVDVAADASEIKITRGTAKFAGGTLALTGRVPLHGLGIGAGDLGVAARNVRLTPEDGVNVTFDADLQLDLNPPTTGSAKAELPHLTGDVTITSFEYTRPIALTTDLSALGVRAKRTEIESYDPALDAISVDVRILSRAPLRIRNNLVEVQLGIESGALTVTGTNQRIGLRGELRAKSGGRFHFRSTEFEIRSASIRFDDPTRIAPSVDVLAVSEYRRYGNSTTAGTGITAGVWHITVHAYGDTDNLHIDMTSDPPLSQEDIILLLTVGMTRAEVDQLQAGALGAGAALEALATVSGADRAVKNAIPVIDDFRFGSAYSPLTGRTEPQVTVGKRITDDVRANVTTGLTEDRQLIANIEWRLGKRVSAQASYDNVNTVTSSATGNIGLDLRWRLEFK
ncbi:MAG: translocation/assembly module TamB domain-containing protein [Polyangiaceae bacterium]